MEWRLELEDDTFLRFSSHILVNIGPFVPYRGGVYSLCPLSFPPE